MQRFTASVTFDRRLADADIAGSLAHARMLAGAGILAKSDLAAIEKGLRQRRSVFGDGLGAGRKRVPVRGEPGGSEDADDGAGHFRADSIARDQRNRHSFVSQKMRSSAPTIVTLSSRFERP